MIYNKFHQNCCCTIFYNNNGSCLHKIIKLLFIILDIQEFYELALQDESHSVTDDDISIAQKYIMDQFDAKVGLVSVYNYFVYL